MRIYADYCENASQKDRETKEEVVGVKSTD